MNLTPNTSRNSKIKSETDLIILLSKLRHDAFEFGFGDYDVTRILTAASELARNILKYAGTGNVSYSKLIKGTELGLELIADDQGPGIADLEKAMKDNYSTSGTLGLGLPGIKRMVDEFEMNSQPNVGTHVKFKVWKK